MTDDARRYAWPRVVEASVSRDPIAMSSRGQRVSFAAVSMCMLVSCATGDT
jgi:hypothetical protein